MVIDAKKHLEFNDCVRYVLEDDDYSKRGKDKKQLMSKAIHCVILNTSQIQSCKEKDNIMDCKVLKTGLSIVDTFLCTSEWFPDRHAFGLNINVSPDLNVSIPTDTTWLDSSVTFKGYLSCTVIGTRIDQKMTIDVDFEHRAPLKRLLPPTFIKDASKYILKEKTLFRLSQSTYVTIALVLASMLMLVAVGLFVLAIFGRCTNGCISR